ncbi:MAG: RHS repeat-associated core domain-containing protein, partial [Candidatus Acidiferrum sp.]
TSNMTDLHVQTYDDYGDLLTQVDYDYGSGSHGSLLDTTTINYAALTNITAFQQQVTVTNSLGATVSQTYYNYGNTVTASSGTPQHTTPPGSRGNLLSINYYSAGSTYLTQSFTYFDTGMVDATTDVNGGVTTYSYSNATSTCGNAFPTGVTEAISSLTQSYGWNCTGGVQTSLTDENNQSASIGYTDSYYWRPNTTTDQLGNQATSWYQPNPTYCCPSGVGWFLTFNSNSSQSSSVSYEDGLGRVNIAQRVQSPGSSTLDTVSYTFDSNGRPYTASVPCSTAAATTCPATPSTATTYDALNRVKTVTDGGGGQTSYSYTNNDVLVTVSPAPTGENSKVRQLEYNSIGQLTSVCEVTAGTTAWPGGNCAQTTAKTGYWTKYAYTPLGQITNVTQNAQSSTRQTRTYAYDLMGRLTSETNPESATTAYVYDTNSLCGTSDGDMVSKTDANGAQTCYYYDALHRLTAVGANTIGGSGCKRFEYDNTTGVLGSVPPGISVSNPLGRLVEAETDTCAWPITSSTMITDEWFSYNQRGDTTNSWASTPHSGGYFHVAASYWANGSVNQISGLTGLPTITYNADGEGRPSTVSLPSGSQNPVTGTTYNPGSLPMTVNFGSGDSDIFSYDPNTLRMTQYQLTFGGSSDKGVLTWNANGTLGGLVITDPINSADSQTCTYVHDDLARLASANCSSSPAWSQTFSYDPFGNIQQSGSVSFLPTYSSTTNHISTIGSSNATYDNDGNVTGDTLHTFSWNQYGRPTTIDGANVTFDAFNRVAEQYASSVYSQYVYAPSGGKLAIMNGQSFLLGFIPMTNGSVAEYWSGGTVFYRHPDWLGSSRLVSSTGQTVRYDGAFSPFGVPYAPGGTSDASFTGMDQDIVANLDDFPAREYENVGRWPSPDPAGLAAVDPTNPQSWNRYAYVLNSPCSLVDPLGLASCQFNISVTVNPSTGLSNQNLVNALIRAANIFSQGTDANGNTVSANFTMNSGGDYTLSFTNSPTLSDAAGVTLFPGFLSTSYVYVNQLSVGGAGTALALGAVAAHELLQHNIPGFSGYGHGNLPPSNIGAVSHTIDQLTGPISPNNLALTPGQIGKLFNKCQKLHPPSRGASSAGGGAGVLGEVGPDGYPNLLDFLDSILPNGYSTVTIGTPIPVDQN